MALRTSQPLKPKPSLTVPSMPMSNSSSLSRLTIAVFAHADLRESYQGNRNSHACAMRRSVGENSPW